jgi:hypothetical protein
MNDTQHAQIWNQYLDGLRYKDSIDLRRTVETNENFYIGKQWEGVNSNGLPTPVFNFLKRVVNFLVATTASDRLKMIASPLGASDGALTRAVNAAFEGAFEDNEIGSLVRRFVRNAAVDGDSCLYTYWDSEIETGGALKGAVRTEILDNTNVIFGNPAERAVPRQPYIIIAADERAEDVKARAEEFGSPDAERIPADGKITTLLKLRRDGKRIKAAETFEGGVIRPEWDTGLTRYPIVWLSWDEVRQSYHGQALVTGLIPNQIFVNKLFAMAMISLMTTAYPKIVYDKTRIEKWDNRAGAAIGVNGGDVSGVARIIEPASISPQIAQFIDNAVGYTQNFMGVTDAALGNVRPDNTSAIIALQRASGVPAEMVRMELYRAIEELGRIYLDFFGGYYGVRAVRAADGTEEKYDYSALRSKPVRLKLDVGVSNYWSEAATVQTMDNLLRSGQITLAEYLERIPDGYIIGKEELLKRAQSNLSPNI